MKLSLRSTWVMILVIVFLIPSAASAFEFGARGYYWIPSLKGDLRVDSDGITGTNMNYKDDLGIDNKNIPSVEAFAEIGKHHISLMYSQVDYSGSKTTSGIIFDGKTYSGLVESDFKLKMLDAEYQYDLLNLENILAGFSIGILGKIKYINGDARLNSASVGETKSTFDFPVPMVGAAVHVGILAKILEARAKFSGMGYSGNYVYDGLAELSITPFPFIDIAGGYRYMKIKVDDISDVTTNTELSGPYVSLAISF